MENIGSQRIQTFDISVPGSCPDNAIASLILILHCGKIKERKMAKEILHLSRHKIKGAMTIYSEAERKWSLINSLNTTFSSMLEVLLLFLDVERNVELYDHC